MNHERPTPVAYIVRGNYVHPQCSQSKSESAQPVHAEELPAVAWCRACEDQILPVEACVFCDIVAGRAEAEWILSPDTWHDAVAFVPLDPVTEGHCLVVPKVHVRDFAASPEVYGAVSRRAAELMQWTNRHMNILTTKGENAGQEIMHLHLHLIPRERGDGLRLLQRKAAKKEKK